MYNTADILWEIGDENRLRVYVRTAQYLDFPDTHAMIADAETATQAAMELWQKWAKNFEPYKEAYQGLPDIFMGKLIPQNAQAHSKKTLITPASRTRQSALVL